MQFMADLELFEWAENRRKEKDVSASEFLYEIVSRQRAAELKVA
jgi:succinate dehydrogenase flavin-adding protein (antitoxin of CptAB toxin-antitoxin module)